MTNPSVTVALPVYNGMPHLPAAIASVLDQTHRDLRLVIIDDGSNDGSTEYIATVDDPRVTVIINEKNLGLEGAWNKALDQSQESTYFKLMCADDVLYPNCIATEVAALDSHPEVAMTACKRVIIDDDDNTLMKAWGLSGMNGVVDGQVAVKRSILFGTNILGEPPAVMLRSSAVKQAGGFEADHKLLIDFDLWVRILQHGALYAIASPLAAFRVGVLSDSLKTMKQHGAMAEGEFRKVAADPANGISKATLTAGIATAKFMANARRGYYKYLDVRTRVLPNKK